MNSVSRKFFKINLLTFFRLNKWIHIKEYEENIRLFTLLEIAYIDSRYKYDYSIAAPDFNIINSAHYLASLPASLKTVHGIFSPGANVFEMNSSNRVVMEKLNSGMFRFYSERNFVQLYKLKCLINYHRLVY